MSDSHHTILIIDDDKLILNTLKKQFDTWQTEVVIVGKTQEALDYLDSKVPDLIILDILLDQPEGYSKIIDFLQKHDNLKNIPVIVLTNLEKPELKEDLLKRGVIKEYLTKGSLNFDNFHRTVWGYLES